MEATIKNKFIYYIISFSISLLAYFGYSLTGLRKGYGFISEPESISESFQNLLENPVESLIVFIIVTFVLGSLFENQFGKKNSSDKKR